MCSNLASLPACPKQAAAAGQPLSMSSCASTPTGGAAATAGAGLGATPATTLADGGASCAGGATAAAPSDSPRSSTSGASSAFELDAELYRSDAFMLSCFK